MDHHLRLVVRSVEASLGLRVRGGKHPSATVDVQQVACSSSVGEAVLFAQLQRSNTHNSRQPLPSIQIHYLLKTPAGPYVFCSLHTQCIGVTVELGTYCSGL
jgi:hypothetical protein